MVKVFEESGRVGKEVAVPRPACPSSFAGLGIMPVHVDNHYVERYLIGLEVVNELAEFLVGVEPVARPPVAERVARGKRNFSGKEGVILQGFLVIMAVSHEIPVLAAVLRAFLYPFPVLVAVEQEAFGVINESPAVGGQESVLERQLFAGFGFFHISLHLRVAVHAVKRAERSLEVAGLFLTRYPRELERSFRRGNLEVVGSERAAALAIAHFHFRGAYLEPLASFLQLVFNGRIFAAYGYERLVVDEFAVGGIFHSHYPVGNKSETHVGVAVNDIGLNVLRLHGCEQALQETEKQYEFRFHCFYI